MAQPFAGIAEEMDSWRSEWKGMPEFVQEDLTPWKSIYVHFACPEDMEKFSELVGQGLKTQQITKYTQGIWYPKAAIGHFADKWSYRKNEIAGG